MNYRAFRDRLQKEEPITESEVSWKPECIEVAPLLIFNWSSPRIKNLNWQTLLDYMACGGGVIFEDPKKVGALASGVSTEEVTVHSKFDFPP